MRKEPTAQGVKRWGARPQNPRSGLQSHVHDVHEGPRLVVVRIAGDITDCSHVMGRHAVLCEKSCTRQDKNWSFAGARRTGSGLGAMPFAMAFCDMLYEAMGEGGAGVFRIDGILVGGRGVCDLVKARPETRGGSCPPPRVAG